MSSWTAPPASRSPPLVIPIPTWSKPSSNSHRSSFTCRGPTSITSRRCASARSCPRLCRCRVPIGRSLETRGPRRTKLRSSLLVTTRSGPTSSRSSARSTADRWDHCRSRQASSTQRRGFGPFVPGVFHAPYANCYRCPIGLSSDNCAAECLRFIEEQLFLHVVAPEEVAAIVVEPIQGEGGYVVPPDVFHERLREITRSVWDAPHRRRSAVGDGAHGQDVRDRAHRRHAGRGDNGEGDCVGVTARA